MTAAGRIAALRRAEADAPASRRPRAAAPPRDDDGGYSVHEDAGRPTRGRDPRASHVVAALRRLVAADRPVVAPPLVFDLETTGLGVDAVPFLVGLAGFRPDGVAWVRQWQLGDLEGERAMWLSVIEALERVDPGALLLTFNGASFDRTVVRLRLRRLGLWHDGLAARFSDDHVDLLPVCRRLWRNSLADVRLVTLEREVLGTVRVGDPSGAEIAELGQRWIAGHRDAATCAGIVAARRHNADDLLGLASLVEACAQAIDAPLDVAQALGVARHLDRVGAGDFVGLLEVWRAEAIRDPDRGIELLLLLASRLRRAGDHDRAHAVLREICTEHRGHPEATRRLVIDLEHRLGRADAALEWLHTMAAPCARRAARLARKLGATPCETAAAAQPRPAGAVPAEATSRPEARSTGDAPSSGVTSAPRRPGMPGSWRGLGSGWGPARRAPCV